MLGRAKGSVLYQLKINVIVTKIGTNLGHSGSYTHISKMLLSQYTVRPKVYTLLYSTFNTGLAMATRIYSTFNTGLALATRIGPATQVSMLMLATAL